MAPIRLYMDWMSQPSRAVYMLLQESKVPFAVEEVPIAKGATRGKQFKAINPNGHVPAIDDNGFILFESHAIMRYLVNKYGISDHFYPRDPSTRARIDSYLDWHHSYLRRGSATLTFSTQFAKLLGVMNDEEIARAKEEGTALLKRSLRIMDQHYLSDGATFLMGQRALSIADLAASTELFMTQQLTGFDLSPYPRVVAWLELVKRSMPDTWPRAHTALMKVVKARSARRAAAEAKAAAGKAAVTTNCTSAAASSAATSSSSGNGSDWGPAAQSLQSGVIFSAIRSQLSSPDGAEAVKKLQSVFRFVVTPAQGAAVTWILDLKNGSGSVVEVAQGADAPQADTTFLLSDANFVSLATGRINPQVAFLSGKLKLQGNLAKAMSFNSNVFAKPTIKAKILEAVQPSQPIKAKL